GGVGVGGGGAAALGLAALAAGAGPPERLGRGVAAVRRDDGSVLVSWRLLATDPKAIAFEVWREARGAAPVKVNVAPPDGPTCAVDKDAPHGALTYSVRPSSPTRGGPTEASFRLKADKPSLSIPLQSLPGPTAKDPEP